MIEYYKSINFRDIPEKGRNFNQFESDSILKLSSQFSIEENEVYFGTKRMYYKISGRGKPKRYSRLREIMLRILVDDDEWYYLLLNFSGNDYRMEKFFKCDQFEGLIDCIKKEVIGHRIK